MQCNEMIALTIGNILDNNIERRTEDHEYRKSNIEHS